jgi:transcriptional regulator with XRE-family HTH domain
MGTRIAQLRLERDLTQQELATKAGLSMRTIAYAEAGRDIRVSTLWLIAEALGVTTDDLLEKASA